MKNINLLIILAFIIGGTVFYACSEEFLDVPPQGALDAGTLANEAGVDAALISAYSMLDGWAESWGSISSPWPASGSNWIWGSVLSDDAHKGSEAGDQGETEELELFQWSPGNPYFNDKFVVTYEGISRTNAAIALLANVEGIDADKSAIIQGEGRFLRGHYHFDAWKMWKNIPYYTEEDTDFRKPNTEDIFPNIIADFEAAVASLPVSQSQVGRATKGAANAYLGKAHLYNQNFSAAKEALDQVVNSGQYALSPCFHDIFSIGQENGPEMVFSIQASVNDGTTEGQNGNFGDRLNFPHGGSPFGCCGFHQPTQNLVNAHKVDDNGLPLFDSFNESDLVDGEAVDPRLDWTVGRDGIPFLDIGVHEPSWIRARSFQGPFSPKKFSYESGQSQQSGGWTSTQLSPVNFPIIRYSDVLLMLAEAEVELGNLERARELTNIVRERAAGCAQGADGFRSGISADEGAAYSNNQVGTYEDTWTDAAAAREAVRYERRIELALEGHRFFDLRRWGTAEEVINEYIEEETPKRPYLQPSAGYQSPKNDLFPIPTIQIELSKIDGTAALQQNPGY